MTVENEGVGGWGGVNAEGTIGGGGERDKVVSVTFSERWVVDERESSGDGWEW